MCVNLTGTMDEVSGRGTSSSAKPNNQCAQCAESGKVVSATGYCRTCSDYLCTSCIEQHKAIRALRDHILLEGETIAEKKPVEVEKCAVHSDRPIEVYCADDDKFVCSLCSLAHRSCKNVALISELSIGIDSSEEFLGVQKAADRCKTLEDQYKQSIEQHLSTNNECHTKAKEEFKLFREEILSIVDEIGTQVFAKADKLMEDNERQLHDIADKITAYSEEVKQYIVNIYDKKNSNEREHMFIALKKYGRHVHESVQRLETLHQNIVIKTFAFHSDPTIRENLIKYNMLKVEDKINTGLVTPLSPAIACLSVSKMNIKSQEDTTNCWVSGMMELSETELIFTDRDNRSLKLLDMASNTIIKRRALTERPWDISRLPESRLAVTLPDLKQIQIFTADRNLETIRSIDVFGQCYCVHCTGDSLIVTFYNPSKVQILDMTGKVLHTIQHDASGNVLFRYPWYLTLNHDNKLIYVSDHEQHNLTCVNNVGVVQWVYQDSNLVNPLGVTTGDGGCLYVCCWQNHTIHVVSSDGKRLALIPSSKTGVNGPTALHYNSQQRTLYVPSGQGGPEEQNNIRTLSLQ